MSTTPTSILFLGATGKDFLRFRYLGSITHPISLDTGYVGGSVLARLISHTGFPTFKITALVRQREKAEKLKELGINAIVGSYKLDLEVLERLAESSHMVINCVRTILFTICAWLSCALLFTVPRRM